MTSPHPVPPPPGCSVEIAGGLGPAVSSSLIKPKLTPPPTPTPTPKPPTPPSRYSLEIAGGLGPTAGKVWRIGVMGYNAQPQNVALVVEAFRDGLAQQGKL
jgi:hypothetical protein